MIYWISYVFVRLFSFLFFPCRYEGKENLPSRGSFILASNHLSFIDPLALGICRWQRFSFVARDNLFRNKIFGFMLSQVGCVPIKRDSADVGAIREIVRRLKKGCPIVIFPEGTRRGAVDEKKIHPGIALISAKSGVPVIPSYIVGSDQALPIGAKWIRRHLITIKFGKPIHFSKDQSYDQMANQIKEEIYALAA